MEREIMVQRDVDGIGGIILIGSEGDAGSEGGKRKTYFGKAAAGAGIRFSFYDWRDFPFTRMEEDPGKCIVKIDAPEWTSCRLRELEALTGQYGERLFALARMPFGAFLNHPRDIAEVLDKRKCKKWLAKNGIAVTKMYDDTFSRREDLLDFMRENRIHQVFLKPVRGSGAAGVAALRFSPAGGKTALYTCGALDGDELVNTKRLYRLEGRDAAVFLDRLLAMDCAVEKWYPKDTFQGYCYDLRIVVQDGRIDYMLPRLSKGPITNLHLNNHSMEIGQMGLGRTQMDDISNLCLGAAGCYPGLKSIGMDVLLERGSRKPYLIEMNAQGDLLHRDIYGENRIYRHQVEIMKTMAKGT